MNASSSRRAACANALRALTLGLLAASLATLGPGIASAAIFTVADGDVAGLIAAIHQANATAGGHTIDLAPAGNYTLSSVDNGNLGLPVVTGQITLNGHGSTIQRSGAPATPEFRIFHIEYGQLTLNQVHIRGGKGGYGAGVGNFRGHLTVSRSTISHNDGQGLASNPLGEGAGVFNLCGTVLVVNSTISHNRSYGGYGGGGILNFSSFCTATTTVVSSTIFENRADGPAGFAGRGDGIADAFSAAGSVVLKNSIVASPTQGLGNSCYAAALASAGHNIVGDASCTSAGSGDLSGKDPLLGLLANNGGATPTHAPLAGSPALDAVPVADCTDATGAPLTADQRGVTRPKGPACDIGSVELIRTPRDLTASIIDQVNALIGAGTLTTGQGAGLIAKLEAVIAKLNRGPNGPACNQLKAFRNQVQAFMNSAALTQAQGQALIATAAVVESQLGC
ncbi:MAG: choice-of-anchor Q domain-containing protein [Rubrivivax sp.]|nr:choice-of-anchor Q domain-containing protein [Rubrivivax sp.]